MYFTIYRECRRAQLVRIALDYCRTTYFTIPTVHYYFYPPLHYWYVYNYGFNYRFTVTLCVVAILVNIHIAATTPNHQ